MAVRATGRTALLWGVTVLRVVRLRVEQGCLTRMRLDADAIARLYDAHADALLGFFVKRTYQPEVAMDLVADTFAAAFADRRRFDGSGDEAATAWLYGIARHRLADFLRRGKIERQRSPNSPPTSAWHCNCASLRSAPTRRSPPPSA
jgi:DNA-directed RNA polymerase specialized sigma24 family protein